MCVKFRPGQKYLYKLCPMQIFTDSAAETDGIYQRYYY